MKNGIKRVEVKSNTLIFLGPNDIGVGKVLERRKGTSEIKNIIFTKNRSKLAIKEYAGVIVYSHPRYLEQAMLLCGNYNLPLITSKVSDEAEVGGRYPTINVSIGELSQFGKLSRLVAQIRGLEVIPSLSCLNGAKLTKTHRNYHHVASGLMRLACIIKWERSRGRLLDGTHPITYFLYKL